MKFSEIPSHYDIKQRLCQIADSGKIPHAILLEGPSGTGKFALARAFAQYIHCTGDKSNGDSCGVCPSCIQHSTFNHIDTFYSFPVIKKSTNPVSDDFGDKWQSFMTEDVFMDFEHWTEILGNSGSPIFYVSESDALMAKLATTSRSAKYKIVLMWLPEKMNEACANKMLKLAEEPQADTLFIITSDNSSEILPTIYSRCQRIRVNRLENTSVADYLVATEGISADIADSISRISGGSITEALRQLKISELNEKFLELFISLMRLAYQRMIIDLRKWSQDISSLSRDQQVSFLDYCCRMLRENFIYNLNEPSLVYLNNSEYNFSEKFARFINERNVLQLNRAFLDAKTDIAGNGNAKFIFFDLSIRVILLLKK